MIRNSLHDLFLRPHSRIARTLSVMYLQLFTHKKTSAYGLQQLPAQLSTTSLFSRMFFAFLGFCFLRLSLKPPLPKTCSATFLYDWWQWHKSRRMFSSRRLSCNAMALESVVIQPSCSIRAATTVSWISRVKARRQGRIHSFWLPSSLLEPSAAGHQTQCGDMPLKGVHRSMHFGICPILAELMIAISFDMWSSSRAFVVEVTCNSC